MYGQVAESHQNHPQTTASALLVALSIGWLSEPASGSHKYTHN